MRDAEFELVVAACGVSIGGRNLGQPLDHINWDRFLALVDRHRVGALCWHGLKPRTTEIPADVAASLELTARTIVAANLMAAGECRRLNDAFGAAKVPLLFLKGLTLGALAYRNPALKMSMDIDVLVARDRIADAVQVLRRAGYLPIIPKSPDDRRLASWHAVNKESVWYRPDGPFQIDLHSRLADNPALLSSLDVEAPRQQVEIGNGIHLPTLTNDQLFAYLCVHGASSAWFRLKWIADLAAWLKGKDQAEIERLYEQSQRLGAGRAAAQALLLANRLFSIELGAKLAKRLATDRVDRWLVGLAENQLSNSAEPTQRRLGTATIHLSQLGLMPGWRFKLSEAWRQLRAISMPGTQ